MEKKDQGTLVAYIDLFVRRKWLFLGIFVALFALLAVGAMSVKSSFRARSLLAIGESESMGLMAMQTSQRGRSGTASATLSGKTYATIVEGLPMAEAVAERLSNDSLTVTAGFIHRAVEAEFYEPELLHISATARDAASAIEIANATAREFIQYNRSQIRSEMQESANFVHTELENVVHELEDINREIAEFKRREQITDLEVEVQELLSAVTEFQKELMRTEADRAEQQARYDDMRAYLFERLDVDVSPLEDPGVQGLMARVSQLEIDLELATAEYGLDHPKLELLQAQVTTTRTKLDGAIKAAGSSSRPLASEEYYKTLRRDLTTTAILLTGLDARSDALERAIRMGRERLSTLPPKQFALRSLELRASISEDKYRRLLERLEAMEVEIEGIQGNATMLDLAAGANPTVSRAMLLIYVAILSLLGAVAVVMTMEYRDNAIQSPDIIASVLGMTNFGTVPKIRNMNREWLEKTSQEDHAFEHYRKLRANVRFASVKKPIKCLAVTSSGPGEGKSSTIANLAVALGQMDQRVLLVDADLRRPNVWRLFEMDANPGVTDILTDDRDPHSVIRKSGIPGLDILTSGPIPPNPAELFESSQMDRLITWLREESGYDMILFDSAPTLLTTDTPVLAAKMDGVLVVIEAGKTTEEQALMTRETLENAGARVLGAVLNKARPSGGGYYYYGDAPKSRNGRPGGGGSGILESIRNLGDKMRTGA